MKLKAQLNDVLREEELLWFQKSRMEAIYDGDMNTRLFHLSTIIRRKQNRIEALQDNDGHWVWEAGAVKTMVLTYFKELFAGPISVCDMSQLVMGSFPVLQSEERAKLDRSFTVTDAFCALNQMSPFKAPGPDGFQALFYQTQWEVVSPSVGRLVMGVLNDEVIPTGLCEAFISLIPNVTPHTFG